jgi:hypothetical protein
MGATGSARNQDLKGDVAVIIPPTPDGKRGVMIAQEGGRWIATLISHFGPSAPQVSMACRQAARTEVVPRSVF